MTASLGREYYQSLIDPDRVLVVPDKVKGAVRRRIVTAARKLGLELEQGQPSHGEAHVSRDTHALRIQQDLKVTFDDCELEPDGSLVLKQELRFRPGAAHPEHRRRLPLTQSNRHIWLSGHRALDRAPELQKALAKAGITTAFSQVHRLPDEPHGKQRYAVDPWHVMVTFKKECDPEDVRGKLSQLLDIEQGDRPWYEARVLKPLDPYELHERFSKLAGDRAHLSFHGLPLIVPLATVPVWPMDTDYPGLQRDNLTIIDAEMMWGHVRPLELADALSPVWVFLVDLGVFDDCNDAPVDCDESVRIDESSSSMWAMGCGPLSGNPHGTQMASVISAAWDGSHMAGITGVAGEMIKLVSLRIASLRNATLALRYAAENLPATARGVVVFGQDILLAYACAVAHPTVFGTDGADFKAKLTEVTTTGTNRLLVILPSGNKDKLKPTDPVQIPMPLPPNNLDLTGTVIAGACTRTGARWDTVRWSSRYGADLWMLAPGDQIHTLASGPPPTYLPDSGTSFAAAHVAGVAALMRSINPGLSVVQLKDKLKMCCAAGTTPPFDPQRGWGVLNGYRAVT